MKKLFYLAMGYLAWNAVSSLYWTKKWKELKKDMKKASTSKHDPKMVLLENFIETHKNFFTDLKDMVESEESKQFFEDKKDDILWLIERYREDSEWMIEELKWKWKKYIGEVSLKLEEFYKEKKREWEEYLTSAWAKEELWHFKEKLGQVYEELKAKIKK